MIAAAAMAAGVAMAATEEVTQISSANVVGYNTQAIAGGKLSCVAFQFAAIGKDIASLKDLSTKNLTPATYDTMDAAPCIMIYDGAGGYNNYYYISDADDGTERFDLTGWTNGSGELVDEVGVPSTGFWLSIPEGACEAGSLTEAGEVVGADTTTVTIQVGLNLIGNPYPVALDLSKVVTAGLVPATYDTMDDAPYMMIYDGVGGYNNYYYISDADDGTERFDLTGWTNGSGELVDVVAPAGTGFWLSTTTAGTLSFSL